RRVQPRGVARPRPGTRGTCKARRTRMRRAPLPSPEQPRRAAPSLRAARFPTVPSTNAASARRPRVASLHRRRRNNSRAHQRPRAGSAPTLRQWSCSRPVAENPSEHVRRLARQNLGSLPRCSFRHAMNNAFVLQDLARFAEVIANVRLLSDPGYVTRDALAEINGWFVTGRSRERGVAGEMAHFAGAKFAIDLRRNVDLQNIGKLFRDFANRCAAGATDIYRQPIEPVRLGCEQIRACDILDEGKIARLLAILIKHRRQIIQQARAKNCNYAGVWIEDRLARSVRAGVTQRDCGNTGLLSPEQHEPLLV